MNKAKAAVILTGTAAKLFLGRCQHLNGLAAARVTHHLNCLTRRR